jgi:hypothetical protein
MAKEESSHPPPRWEIVNKAYDMLDSDMDKMVNDLNMNYLELGIVMMMVNEKLNQEKVALYLEYLKQEDTKEEKKDSYIG